MRRRAWGRTGPRARRGLRARAPAARARASSHRRPRPRSRTARRRCRRCGRGRPACAPSSPASGSSRRRSRARACATWRSAKRRWSASSPKSRNVAGGWPLPTTSCGQPLGVEAAGLRPPTSPCPQVDVRVEQVARDLQVLVDRLARDQQVHDLARALEDAVDAHVAQRLLDRHRLLAACLQRLGGLVAAPAAHLDELVDDPPAHLRAVELRDAPPRCGCRSSCRRRAGWPRRASPRGRSAWRR